MQTILSYILTIILMLTTGFGLFGEKYDKAVLKYCDQYFGC